MTWRRLTMLKVGRLMGGVAVFLLGLWIGVGAAQTTGFTQKSAALEIQAALKPGADTGSSELKSLRAFYEARQDQPAWYDARGLNSDGKLAISAMASSGNDGLDPVQYELANISKPLTSTDPAYIAERDVFLTRLTLRFISDVRDGRVALRHIDTDIDLPPSGFDAPSALSHALANGHLLELLSSLAPQTPMYIALKVSLARYREISSRGGWKQLAFIKPVDAFDTNDAVRLALWNRLAAEDVQLLKIVAPSNSDIDGAIRKFQLRNGLTVDGIVGRATLAALNISAGARVLQIAANMERARWLPHNQEKTFVAVNVPDATLHVVDNGAEILTSRVIVGRPADRTPIFRAEITDVIANPPWVVPSKIARQEILPKVRMDPAYLAAHDMILKNGEVQQLPGAKNALGRLKLNVTDRFLIYLHDTPSRSLFAREKRFLSHGCIRVQKIMPLASYVMTGDITGGVERLMSLIAQGRTVRLPLAGPISLYVEYFTVFPSSDGILQFRPDIYGRDARMIEAMNGTTLTQARASLGSCSGAT